MATTTNYGWTTPNDTDLVKDGASAIRTLGSAIDTTVFNNASAGIAKTLIDAKGDLIAGSAADTAARLAVGTNGQLLTADSTASTGLAWTTISGGGMTLLSTTTLSGATVTINSISQSYNDLIIYIYGQTNATANGQLRCYARNTAAAATFDTTMNYTDNTNSVNYGIPVLNRNDSSATRIKRTDATNSWIMRISNYTATGIAKPFIYYGSYMNENDIMEASNGAGGFYTATNPVVDSLLLQNNGGNFSTGTVKIYGVK